MYNVKHLQNSWYPSTDNILKICRKLKIKAGKSELLIKLGTYTPISVLYFKLPTYTLFNFT